ncbi:MAG: glycoside hydrolase family 78 protein [Dysgonamonadaceae bacterium]|jgi:alpha-L-rhamnosidase|nr:glycoside hydrolase family 78 protein [Dysgonamonadaceae bacterium]
MYIVNLFRRCDLLLAVISFLCFSCSDPVQLQNLRTEYLTEPLGIDTDKPRFSWNITTHQRDVIQSAYRVIVSDKLSTIQEKKGNRWDTGWIDSDNTIQVQYAGQPLTGNTQYYWRVCSRIGDKEIWSVPATFHTGLLNQSDWTAHWIGTKEDLVHESPLFRRDFSIEKKVKEAFVYTAAAGFYELYLNGEKVGDHVLDPAITDYRKTVLYSVFDVTDQLKVGGNTFGVMLANGAYNLTQAKDRYSWGGSRLGNPCFTLQLHVTYIDGSEGLVTSDNDWKYTLGPITFNNIYGGEDYDARKEIDGWASPGLDASAWKAAAVVQNPGGKLIAQQIPIRVTETLTPVAQIQPSEGVYLFDLGQNIAGWWRVEVKGAQGQTIRVRGAETLNDSLFAKNLEAGDKLSTKFVYHSHTWTDYTLKSEKKEVYEPRFFYTGFRYIEVATEDGKNLQELKVQGRVTRSDIESSGSWNSSNELLNRIYKAGLWSQKGNLVGYPTDCPHREKGAYNGDGQVIAESSMHDFLMAPFYYKWLNDMRDSQHPNGWIPNTSPPIVGGMGGGIAWGSAYVLIPWWMYQYYDDKRVLEQHYPAMKNYVGFLRNLARYNDEKPDEPYIINYFDGYWYSLGEWCSPGRSDCPNHAVINTFYYYYDTWLLSQIADVLGHPDEAGQYRALADTVKSEFIKQFFNPETGLFGMENEVFQPYQLVALVGNLVPLEHRDAVLASITDDLKKRDNHLNTGIVGTKYLWPALVNGGYHDLAYSVAIQETYPSYGFWIRNNSTTLLEQWDGHNSHNHQMFGSITEYFYKYLAGIQSPVEGKTTNGYRHIHLQPYLPDSLESVRASLKTLSGEIVAGWEKKKGGYRYAVTVPANTTATVALPVTDAKRTTITERGNLIWKDGQYQKGVNGVREARIAEDRIEITFGSGNYAIEVRFDYQFYNNNK